MPDAENPVRAEFWGDEITDLSFFDIDTQRRGEKAGEIRLSPSAEVIIEDRTALADKIENLAKGVRGKKLRRLRKHCFRRRTASGRAQCFQIPTSLFRFYMIKPKPYLIISTEIL